MSSSKSRASAAGVRRTAGKRGPHSRPTIRSVAERAEVAISTVSRVVNGGRASEAVRRKVQRAVLELGYSPSVAAQSLVRRQAGCIGLAVNSSQSPWFSQILAGVEEALAPGRQSVLISSMMLSGTYDPSPVLSWIQDRRVDGVILVRRSERDQALLDAADAANMPAVLIAPDQAASHHFTVRCNNLEAGRLAAQHLVDLGHRRIAFGGGPRESVDSRMRLAGIEEVLHERGLEMRAHDAWFGSAYGRAAGVRYAERFLQTPRDDRPSAVILGNDPMALGFMRTVLGAGGRVPHEVSVVGFDGTPDGEQCWPGLTTVKQPTRQMAAAACSALLQSIAAPDVEPPTSTEYPVELVIRESTAAPT